MTTIKTLLDNNASLSLKRICETAGLCYQYVLKASKQPIPNTPYDPEGFNDDAVMKIVERRKVNLDDFDWNKITAEIAVRVPAQTREDFPVDTLFKMRGTKRSDETTPDALYKVVYSTEFQVVFQCETMGEQYGMLRVMNWDTFFHQSPRKTTATASDENNEEGE